MITETSVTTARADTIDLESLQLQSDTIRQTKLQLLGRDVRSGRTNTVVRREDEVVR